MKIKIKYLTIPIVALFLLGMTLAVNPSSILVINSEGLNTMGHLSVYKNNELVYSGSVHSLVNNGKTWVQNQLGAGYADGPATVIAVGNGSAQSSSDTALPGIIHDCGLANATGTYVSAGTGSWNVTYQWTSTCNNEVVNQTGLYNGTTQAGTILFAETTFTGVTLQANDKLNVTWGIDVTG